MLPLNVRKPSIDRGFTLAEILTVLVITGILAAFVGPNLLSWSHRQRMQAAANLVQGAMEDAQRQAIRLGKKCTVQLDGVQNDELTSYNRLKAKEQGQGQCLVATADSQALTLPKEVRIVTNIQPVNGIPETTFSFLGHVAYNFRETKDFPMVVLYSTLNPNSPKTPNRCVVIASLLGSIRMGIYEGSLSDLDATKCRIHSDGIRS